MEYFIEHLFNGVAVILTGLFALLLFYLRLRKEKRDAATILLLEIRNAEKEISKLRETKIVNEYTSIMPTDSLSKYAHYFTNNLNYDELSALRQFYNQCIRAEKSVRQHNDFFPLAMREKSKALQQKLVDLADKENYEGEKEKITSIMHDESYWFKAHVPKQRVLSYVYEINPVLNSSVGEKLKKISTSRL